MMIKCHFLERNNIIKRFSRYDESVSGVNYEDYLSGKKMHFAFFFSFLKQFHFQFILMMTIPFWQLPFHISLSLFTHCSVDDDRGIMRGKGKIIAVLILRSSALLNFILHFARPNYLSQFSSQNLIFFKVHFN